MPVSQTRNASALLRRPAARVNAKLGFSLIVAAVSVVGLALADESTSRPNIILIMADDMGYECVGANGCVSYQTPHLDRLARTGLRFTNCHSQPICTPSRVQLMTGIYNDRNYIKFGLLDPRATTFGHLLQRAGYATCIVGKWQLQGGAQGPRNFGFDESCLWQVTQRPGRYPNPGIETNGIKVRYSNGEYGPDIVCDYLCDFIQRHQDQSFFAYYPMILPHWPFEPTPDSHDYDPTAKGVLQGVGEAKYFADMVAYTDGLVGRIVEKLEQLGLRERTLLLFTGDNGTYNKITTITRDGPVQGGKGSTPDNGTHVPMIANLPGVVPGGAVCDDLIDFSDYLPTVVEMAGAALPEKIHFDGVSFAPQLRASTPNPKPWIYCWYERNGKRDTASQHVRTKGYKLYADGRFFDVVADFYEQNPLRPASLIDDARANYDQLQLALKQMLDPSRLQLPK